MRSGSQPELPATTSDRLFQGYGAVFATVVIWSTPSLFQFYLNQYYDPWAQNLYRYSVAFLAILPFVVAQSWRKGPRLTFAMVLVCLVPSIPNVVHQVTQVMALYHMGPGVFAILTRASVILTAVLAVIFFPEERFVIRQWQFQLGTLFGLLGAVGVLWFQDGGASGHIPPIGIALGGTAVLGWALYGILVKRPAAELGSVRSFGLISLLTSAILVPLTLVFGNIAAPLHVDATVNGVMALSAVTCISMAHVLYYVAIQRLGVALSQTLQLLCPAGALGLSALIFGERLSIAQLWSAAILLFGAFLAMRVRPPMTRETSENV